MCWSCLVAHKVAEIPISTVWFWRRRAPTFFSDDEAPRVLSQLSLVIDALCTSHLHLLVFTGVYPSYLHSLRGPSPLPLAGILIILKAKWLEWNPSVPHFAGGKSLPLAFIYPFFFCFVWSSATTSNPHKGLPLIPKVPSGQQYKRIFFTNLSRCFPLSGRQTWFQSMLNRPRTSLLNLHMLWVRHHTWVAYAWRTLPKQYIHMELNVCVTHCAEQKMSPGTSKGWIKLYFLLQFWKICWFCSCLERIMREYHALMAACKAANASCLAKGLDRLAFLLMQIWLHELLSWG